MSLMQMIWKRLEMGFERLDASILWEAFRPGATDTEIQETEGFLGITLPDDVKTSYQIHNGSGGKELIGDPDQMTYQFYSLSEMMSDWQQERNLQREIDQRAEQSRQEQKRHQSQPGDGIKENGLQDIEETFLGFDQQVRCNPPDRGWWWHPKWLPLLRSGSGVRLCLDLAPGPAGQIGQIIKLDVDSTDQCPSVVASSWQALLLTFAQDLEAGEYCVWEDISGGLFLSFA